MAAAAAGMIFFHLPNDNRLWSALQNTGHCIVFCILSISYVTTLNRINKNARLRNIFITVVVLALAGFAVELLQLTQAGRSTSTADLLRNFAGIIAGILLFSAFSLGRAYGWLTFLVIVLALALLNLPSIKLLSYQLLKSGHPYVINFSDHFVESNIAAVNDAKTSIIMSATAKSADTSKQLQVEFGQQQYNGVIIHSTGNRWVETDWLILDIHNPEASGNKLHLRIHDSEHNNQYTDRYNATFTLNPGDNQLTFSVRDIETMGGNTNSRKMNLQNIRELQIFSTEQRNFRIYIQSIFIDSSAYERGYQQKDDNEM